MTHPRDEAEATSTDEILIVDDQEVNRILLTEILRIEGYPTFAVSSGSDALERIAEVEPALVLLDVNMPGMDGFAVCRRIRETPRTASLPVILVTALGHREHRLEGIAAGANDYLTKPIDRADLLLRIRNAMHLRRLHRRLADSLGDLRRLERLRDSLVHMLVHDLRAPLTTMMAYLEVTRTTLAERGDEELVADLSEVTAGANLLSRMVNDVLDVSRLEENALPLRRQSVDFYGLSLGVIARVGHDPSRINVVAEGTEQATMVWADESLLHRVVRNLIDNAIKFSPRGSTVYLRLIPGRDEHELQVIDAGPGIPAEHHDRIFRKFGTVELGRIEGVPSSGLGLTFCKMVIEAHGGRIGVRSTPGSGSTFWVTCPIAPPQA